MPAVTQVILFDDEAWPERVLAEEVVRVTIHWQAIEGEERGQESIELYLTSAGRQELEKDLARWLGIGHRPGSRGSPREPGTRHPARPGKGDPGRRDYLGRVREFADSRGLRSKDGLRPVYESPGGGWNYPDPLLDEFDAWETAGCPPLDRAS
jgi:hypothetical protein